MALFDDLVSKDGTSLTAPTGSGLFDNIPQPPGPIASGFKTGVAGVKSAAGGLVSMAGRGFGVKGLEQAGEKITTAANEEAAMYARRAEDITSVGDAVDFAQYGIATALPSMLAMLAGGGAGRIVGGVAARKITEDATRRLIQQTGLAGGAVGTSMALEAGGIYPEAVKEGVGSPVARAIAGGVVAGALDVVPEFYLARKLGILGEAAKGTGSRLANAAKTAGKSSLLEGATEGAQTGIERIAAGQPLSDEEAKSDYLNSILVGMISGGAFGGAAGALAPVQKTPENEQIVPDVSTNPEKADTTPLPGIDLNAQYPAPAPAAAIEPPSPYGTINADVPLPPELRTVDQVLADRRAQLLGPKEEAAALVSSLEAELALPASERQGRSKGAITKELMSARTKLDVASKALREVDNETIAKDVFNVRRAGGPRGPLTDGTVIDVAGESAAQTDRPIQPPSIPVALEDRPRQAFAVQTTPFERTADKVATLQGVPLVELPEGSPQSAPQNPNPDIIVPDISTYESSRGVQKQGTPQQKQRSFIENSLQAVDVQTKELVDTGALPRQKAEKIRGIISRELEQAFDGTQDPGEVRDKIEGAIARAVKGRINKGDAETFTNDLLAKIAGQPREFLSQGGVNTPEFKKWFGGSVVTDSVGEPLRVYHQTASDFEKFVPGGKNPKLSGPAIWFRPDPSVNMSLHNTATDRNKKGIKYSPGAREIPAYVSLKNAIGSTPSSWKEVYGQFENKGNSPWVLDEAFVKEAKAKGYDGIMHFDDNGVLQELAVFDADQVRNAITFDSKSSLNQTPDQLSSQGQKIYATLQRLIGDPADVEVRVFEQNDPQGFAGRYRTGWVKDIIEIALNARDPLSVAAHEAFHRIETKHLNAQERAILRRGLKKGTPIFNRVVEAARKYDADNGTNIASEIESVPQEARAYGFEMWRRGELEATGPIQKVFQKIQRFLERVKNYVSGLGFTSVEDIYRAVDMGAYAKTAANPLMAIDATQAYKFVDEAMESKGVVDNKAAAWTPARVESMIKTYGTSFNENTKAYVAMMSPQEFLDLTASKEQQANIAEETGPLNKKKLAREDQEIYLDVDPLGKGGMQVISHEGRHRMTALMRAGHTRVPVTINTRTADKKEKVPTTRLLPQKNGVAGTLAFDLIPLNHRFANDINQAMSALEPTTMFSKNENGDPSSDEAASVEKNLTGKDPLSAAKWLSDNAPDETHRLIANKVYKQLSRLKAAGMKFDLKVAHVGDKVPTALLGARGIALSKFAPNDASMTVWLNGADVIGKVGTSYETTLHELVHAATMSAVRLGNMKKAAGTKLATDVADLYAVSNAIIRHFNQRVKGGVDNLTQFEKEMYARSNNAFVNPNETVAWALTNRDAQAYLESIQYQGKSLWTQFVEAVRKFLGLDAKADTALSEVLRLSESLLEAPVNELESIAGEVGQSLQIQAPINQEFLSRGALTSTLAPQLQEIVAKAKDGSAEATQVISTIANLIDGIDLPKNTAKDFLGAQADSFKGGLARAYLTHISSGLNLARVSQGFKNVFNVVTAYEQRKNRLIAEGVDVQLKTWQNKRTSNENIAKVSKALMDRTVDGVKVGTPEYNALLAPLNETERRMFDEATKMIASQLDAEFVADQRTMAKALGVESEAYQEWLENRTNQVQRLKDEGYVPERRFGDHVVYATVPSVNQQGSPIEITVLREQFESQAEASLRLKQYQEAFGGSLKVQYGFKYSPEHDASLSYQQFLDMARRFNVEVSQAEKERLAKAMISADSVRRNRIFRRKNVAGYSEDGLRVLSEFAVTMANKIAYSEYSGAIADAQQGKAVTVGANGVLSVDEKSNVWTEDGPNAGFLRQRTDDMVDFVLQPQRGGGWSRTARMAASLHFLGGSVAAAVVQASALPMVSAPYLSQFTGYANANGKVLSAFRTSLGNSALRDIEKLQNRSVKIPEVDAVNGLRDALARAAEDGTTLDTEIYQIMGQSRGSMLSKSRTARRALEAWMYPFREAEKVNRTATFMATYKIGQENKMTGDKLYEFARDAVYNTQNRFDEANRPGLARNPIWALLFTFKATPIFLTETIVHLHKQNPKAAVFMLTALFIAAGINGMPFAEDLMDVVDTLAQRLFKSPFNSQRALKNILKNASEAIVGTDLSGVFLNGLVNELTGLSFASRVGLGNLIPGTRMFAADADYKRVAQEMLGPVASQVIGGFEAVESLSKGDFVQAIRQGGPLAAQNAVKSVEQWSKGYAQDAGGRKLVDVGGFEALMQGLGFSSAAVNHAYQLDRMDKQAQAFYQMVRTDFTKDIVSAVRDGNQEKIMETVAMVNAWNQTHPDMPIALNPGNIRKTIAEAGMPLNQRTLMNLPKQLRGSSEAYELTRDE